MVGDACFGRYREAARECRRKKKEYIKCLENRVALLENQNKTLIEELKSLKELYCQKEQSWARSRRNIWWSVLFAGSVTMRICGGSSSCGSCGRERRVESLTFTHTQTVADGSEWTPQHCLISCGYLRLCWHLYNNNISGIVIISIIIAVTCFCTCCWQYFCWLRSLAFLFKTSPVITHQFGMDCCTASTRGELFMNNSGDLSCSETPFNLCKENVLSKSIFEDRTYD